MFRFNSRCRTHISACKLNQPASKANSALHPSEVGKWVPSSAGKAKAGMVHSVSGWTRGVHVKLWYPSRTGAIPELLRGVFMTQRYTNPRLRLPLLLWCLVYSFLACRSASDVADNRVFTIDKCQSAGRVIYIQGTWVGFSGEWKATDNPTRCRASRTCYRRIQHNDITNCNGKGSCSFSPKVINFPTKRPIPCPNATKPNFIWIKYSCISSKKMLSHYAFILFQNSVYLSACYQNSRQQQSKVANYAVIKLYPTNSKLFSI